MRVKEKLNLAIKPVYPRFIQNHGLFGEAYVKQHMVIDEHWTPDSLTQEFKKMTLLLGKYSQFNRLEKKSQYKTIMKTYWSLKKQCRNGRLLLKHLRTGNPQKVRNILKDHRQMQRLYQKMPFYLIEDNINQRTFVMRKEHDRLVSRLQRLEKTYNEKLLEKSSIESRIYYENEFKLAEESNINDLRKKLKNSEMRLQAAKTINSTYERIIQILRHDKIFYKPILHSLDADIEDQSKFIKHILLLGSPAIVRFKELSDQYKLLDERDRKLMSTYKKSCANFRKKFSKPQSKEIEQFSGIYYRVGRYVRETKSMLSLKEKFEEIEEVIKKIKITTLCSNAKDIYSRLKSQINNNWTLASNVENDMLGHEALEAKMKFASVQQGVLVNNLAEAEIKRLERIKKLKEAIKREDVFEENILIFNKSRANIFVLLRYFLWNLYDITKHVGNRHMPTLGYPVDHLKLPLLKYEMLAAKAYAPDPFEENISKLFNVVQAKLKILTKAFDWHLGHHEIDDLKKTYCKERLNTIDVELLSGQESRFQLDLESEENAIDETRFYKTVLNRNQIKNASARLVDECMKRDE